MKVSKTVLIAWFMISTTMITNAGNEISFSNQSGEPALVKVIGPSPVELQVSNGGTATHSASPGRYYIMTRYGFPNRYRYTKGEPFDVSESVTAFSKTSITLHKVAYGNYGSKSISESEFSGDLAASPRSTPIRTESPAGSSLGASSPIYKSSWTVSRKSQKSYWYTPTGAFVGKDLTAWIKLTQWEPNDDTMRQLSVDIQTVAAMPNIAEKNWEDVKVGELLVYSISGYTIKIDITEIKYTTKFLKKNGLQEVSGTILITK